MHIHTVCFVCYPKSPNTATCYHSSSYTGCALEQKSKHTVKDSYSLDKTCSNHTSQESDLKKTRDIFRFIGKGSFRAWLGFSLWLQCKSKQFLWSAEKIRGTLVLFTAGLIINHKFLIHPAGAFVLFFKLRSSTRVLEAWGSCLVS